MDIKILDSWLREFIDTKATPTKIAECLSLCGPSVEKVEKIGNDWLYHIEITTNRVDQASVYGIAKEATAILPRFGIKANLKPLPIKESRVQKALPLILKTNPKLTPRIMAVVIENIRNWQTPDWMKKRLETAGIRSLNAIVDVTNYVMTEVGHPTHIFDYDRITTHKIIIRESNKNEEIVTLDGKKYHLPGGDIVIDDGTGKIIDLPGIMGTENSVVTSDTKRAIFFLDDNDPVRLRKTSMTLGIRTVAETLNEKGVDPESAKEALLDGIRLFQEVCKADIATKIYDIYPNPYKPRKITVSHNFIEERLGIEIKNSEVISILASLGFMTKFNKKIAKYVITIPSWRSADTEIPEDIVEEVARLHGYHNLPSILMQGKLPDKSDSSVFDFESKVKQIMKALGATEVYTLSLVPKACIGGESLQLKNPLGPESEYLRISLRPSLIFAAEENAGYEEPFHLFEVANIYLPQKDNLPDERMILAGIFSKYSFREAKGVIESLLSELHTNYTFESEDAKYFVPSQRLTINASGGEIGEFGILENSGYIYYEFDVETLRKNYRPFSAYKPIPRYPAQIEDLTFTFPPKTKIGEVLLSIKQADRLISDIQLTTIYQNAYTFRIWYQNPVKTLTDKEVENLRKKVFDNTKSRFGGQLKTSF